MYLLQLILYGLFLMLDAQQITKSAFSCDGRVSGYYADVGTGCQVYHMCDGLGRKFSFVCPNATLFQQRMLICDHWFMVNCSKSESEYGTNLLIGQKGKPFVEDSNGQSAFQRTPRPDYASGSPVKNHPIDLSEETNLVGINSDENQNGYNLPSRWSTEYNKIKPTADPKDNQFSRRNYQEEQNIKLNKNQNRVTQTQNELSIHSSEDQNQSFENDRLNHQVKPEIQINFESHYKATTPVYPKFVEDSLKLKNLELAPPKIQTIQEINELQNPGIPVNFESNFNATTPVYPTFVDENLKFKNIELPPPKENYEEIKEDTVHVNFESNFKATTPVYPSSVDDILKLNNLELFPPLQENDEKNDVKVNFVSDFRATTPVYPLSVESTSLNPDKIGLLPPLDGAPILKDEATPTTPRVPVNFESNFLATVPNYPMSVEATSPLPDEVGLLPPIRNGNPRFLSYDRDNADEPSNNYEPPLYDVGYVDPNGALASIDKNNVHVLGPKIDDWNELRRKFSVPDYEFPLDSTAHKVNYDSDLSSFQPRASGGLQKR